MFHNKYNHCVFYPKQKCPTMEDYQGKLQLTTWSIQQGFYWVIDDVFLMETQSSRQGPYNS